MFNNLVLIWRAIKDVMTFVVFLVWRFVALHVKPSLKQGSAPYRWPPRRKSIG